MSNSALRAAIYTRVSRDAGRELRSVTEQEADCRAWVDTQGWRLVDKEVWCDNDISASQYARKTREEWQDLLETINAGDVDVLVVWEPARATRDMVVWANFAALCSERDVKIAASGRVYDLTDPEDAFQLNLFFALAAREPAIIRKRVNRAHRANAAAGTPHGRIPYGYRREYKALPGKQVLLAQLPDERVRTSFAPACVTRQVLITLHPYSRAGVVRDAARRLLKGESLRGVVHDLNRRGVPVPHRRSTVLGKNRSGWDPSVLKKMMINPTYAGLRVFQGEVVGEAAWPALLEPNVYYPLVAKLTDPERKKWRDGALTKPMSGVLTCGACGGKLRSYGGTRDPKYACVGAKTADGDKSYHVSRRVRRVHEMIEGLVALRLSQPDALEAFTGDGREAERLKSLLNTVSELRARHAEHVQLAARGELSAMALAGVEKELLPQIERAEREMRGIRLAPLVVDLVRPTPEEVARRWALLQPSQQRQVVQALFGKITVFPIGRGEHHLGDLLTGVKVVWRRPMRAAAVPAEGQALQDGVVEFPRVVPKDGRIVVKHQHIRLGLQHAGKSVIVRLEPEVVRFFYEGQELACRPRVHRS